MLWPAAILHTLLLTPPPLLAAHAQVNKDYALWVAMRIDK